jgi:Skp family chaperone for outer membrane proteins
MKKQEKLKLSLLLPLACVSLAVFFMPLTASAGSPRYSDEVTEYVLTEYQYQKLNSNLTELKRINENYKKLLTQSKGQLGTSDKKLAELEKKSDELNSLCLTLKIKVKEQESLLTSANQSLAELEKEYNLKQKRIKKQRNIAYVIATCALYAAMKN